jgi:hypothetical protein
MRISLLVFASLALGLSSSAPAHPGGLNAEGCHNNRKTGEYHCHRGSGGYSSSLPQSLSSTRTQPAYGGGGSTFPTCAPR